MDTLDKECPVCGTYFVGRSDKQYCSGRCRIKAHRQVELDTGLNGKEPEQIVDISGHSPTSHDSDSILPWVQSTLPVSINESTRPMNEQSMVDRCISRLNKQEAAAKFRRQQIADVALAKEINAIYVQIIDSFLEGEGHPLSCTALQELADQLMDAREDYKSHPYLCYPDNIARDRLNDLRDALRVVQEAQREAQQSWFAGQKGQYDLKGKWRRELRERLFM